MGLPMASGSPVTIEETTVSSVRLVRTLALAGAIAGLVIVVVYGWTQPRIQAYQAEVLRVAVFEVLGGPERYETAFLLNGSFTTAPPAAADTSTLERVYVGFDAAGRSVGIAVAGGEPGFQDVIRLLFGYDPGSEEVIGMKVLEMKETPGLGDKIEKDSTFVSEFAGVATPLAAVRPARASGAENEVEMITGATISSKAVVEIINNRLEALGTALATYWASGSLAGRGESAPAGSVVEVATGADASGGGR